MKLMICGFGRVGRAFAELFLQKRLLLQDKYGLDASVGAVVDLLGASVELDESQRLEGRATRKLVLGTHTGTHMDAPLHFMRMASL